jgi:signal transduction histidine kinase
VIAVTVISTEITDRKHAEEALKQANTKLNLLSGITRHDIRNQLVVLRGFLEISKRSLGDAAKMSEYILREEQAAKSIEHQIDFTKQYQDLGVNAPTWQNVEETIKKTQAALPARDIRIIVEVGTLEVYADPLFEKVFYNLIDNALKYGGETLTAIHIFYREVPDGLMLICEDDGAGISVTDKTRLFEKGFGKNTGLGLFLSREILGITGITIRESGEPGKGARFGVLVPKAAYRFVPASG